MMRAARAWRLDVAGLLLLAAGLVSALAVFSYDPADVPGVVHPPHPSPRNILGEYGAALAHELVSALGAALPVWFATWFVLVLVLFVRRDLALWSLRLCGWLLLVPAAAVSAQRWLLPTGSSPVVGPGGSVGAWIDTWLREQFSPAGQLTVIVSALVLATALAGQFALRPAARLLRWLVVRGGRGLFRLIRLGVRLLVLLIRLPLLLGKLRRPRRMVVPPPLPADPTAKPLPELEPRPVLAEIRPVVAAGGFRAAEEIPIKHHEHPLLPGRPRDPDEPELEERSSLSNGLHSERQRFAGFELPPLHLLEDARAIPQAEQDQQLREKANLLEKTFRDFGLSVKVVGINTGPVVTMYEISLETGLRVSKVTSLADDIALNLKVPSVRIVAPLPGKNAVGIEIPNELRADVRLKEVIQTSTTRAGRSKLPLFLGKDAEGRPLVCDLADSPHLLIAGTTGTGKSVCLTTIILSLLMTRRPDEVRLVLIDPKSGVEMQWCSQVPHLMCPIIEDMKKAEAVLAWAVDKMEERYDLLKRARVRNIAGYNELSPEEILRRAHPLDEEERRRIPERMSYIVIVIDEMADLMMQFKKEVEGYIIRLAQKSRAAGIHLVLATQKPTVDVITGLIKSNLPSRICFKVAQKSDSRVVLDQMGADKLLGRGDLLFLPPGTSDLVRAQGAFAGEPEILRIADYLESEPCYDPELLQLKTKEVREAEESGGSLEERLKSRDKLYEQAVEVVIREGRGSVSLLQRILGIGYGRAARLIDFMAQDGIVGAYNGSNARDVNYTPEQWASARTAAEKE